MATPRKKPSPKKVQVVDTNEYNRLEIYCIWLNEYYTTLKRAGFNDDMAFWLITNKDSYPDWVNFKLPTNNQIADYMDEDED